MDAMRPQTCGACGAALREEDFDEARGRATCSFCGTVHAQPTRAGTGPRALAGLPPGLLVDDDGRRLRLVRRWYAPIYLFLLCFTGVWFAFLTFWYAIVSRTGAPVLFLLFPLLHVAVGLGLAYVTLAGLLNRTVVEVERMGSLTVRSGPIPWRRGVTIEVADVAQLFVTEKRYQQHEGPPNYLYGVEALTRRGLRVPLVRGMIRERTTALAIEQAIEGYLKLPDRPVEGELSRT